MKRTELNPESTLKLTHAYETPDQQHSNASLDMWTRLTDMAITVDTYFLTTDHSSSCHGQPVLLKEEPDGYLTRLAVDTDVTCRLHLAGNDPSFPCNQMDRPQFRGWLQMLGTSWTQATGG